MTYVLVHGATFDGSCWDLLLPHLDGPAIAVDLPGRGSRPADLTQVTIQDFVDVVVDEIECCDLHDVVLVGHPLAGITLPGVAAPEDWARAAFCNDMDDDLTSWTLAHMAMISRPEQLAMVLGSLVGPR